MKATGIVRRIDDLGRVVIPKEIRRTMRIREGDPLEIYTEKDGEVIFKKYSPMGELANFAAQICESMHKTTGEMIAICDRDTVIAVSGGSKRELMDKRISSYLEQLMENRSPYFTTVRAETPVSDASDDICISVASPIIASGDVLGCVVFCAKRGSAPLGDTENKLAQTVAGFLGRQMEE